MRSWTLGVGSGMGRIVSDAATDPRGLRCECMDADRVVVGIDNGATKNNATVLDASGRFLVDRMYEIPSRVAQGPEAAIEAMAETMDLVLRDTGTDRSRVVAVGLDTPGPGKRRRRHQHPGRNQLRTARLVGIRRAGRAGGAHRPAGRLQQRRQRRRAVRASRPLRGRCARCIPRSRPWSEPGWAAG